MSSFKLQLNAFFILLMLALFINHFAEAAPVIRRPSWLSPGFGNLTRNQKAAEILKKAAEAGKSITEYVIQLKKYCSFCTKRSLKCKECT